MALATHRRDPSTVVDFHLTVDPDALYIIGFPRRLVPRVACALLEYLFFPSRRRSRFFSFTHIRDQVSIIADSVAMERFIEAGGPDVNVSPASWRAICISEGDLVTGNLAPKVSKVMTANGFSIFYLSTCSHDYILVKNDQLAPVLKCLEEAYHVTVQALQSTSTKGSSLLCSKVYENSANRSMNETPDPVGDAKLQVQVVPGNVYLQSMDPQVYPDVTKAIMHIVFFVEEQTDFFSFTETAEEVSLILDEARAALFRQYVGVQSDTLPWRCFKVLGDWGFNETGLVHSLSQPLDSGGITMFYLSTFNTDYVMTAADDADVAIQCFEKEGFEVQL